MSKAKITPNCCPKAREAVFLSYPRDEWARIMGGEPSRNFPPRWCVRSAERMGDIANSPIRVSYCPFCAAKLPWPRRRRVPIPVLVPDEGWDYCRRCVGVLGRYCFCAGLEWEWESGYGEDELRAYPLPLLRQALGHASANWGQLPPEASGCFSCLAAFPVKEVTKRDGKAALCPRCHAPTVLPDGWPLEVVFLLALRGTAG